MPVPQIRTRWAAVGAALAVSLGAGSVGLINATAPDGAAAFVPITPCRLFDTRPAPNTVGPRTAPLGPDETYTIEAHGAAGSCNLPDAAVGLVLNVTAVDASQATFLTLFPAGVDRPNASHLNPSPGTAPAPNAVTVDLSSAGQFSVFNRFGNVHVLADVVGYYTDHHHDDRYYTKQQADAVNADFTAALDAIDRPWSIHIAASDLDANRSSTEFWPALTFGSGVTAAGMAFNDGVFSRVWYGFQVPPEYVAGTDIQVDMGWIPVSGFGAPVLPCDSVWSANGPYVSRPDAAGFTVSETWEIPNNFAVDETRLRATPDLFANSIVSTTYMLIDGDQLLPGDALAIALNRRGADAADTCEGMLITGLIVHAAA